MDHEAAKEADDPWSDVVSTTYPARWWVDVRGWIDIDEGRTRVGPLLWSVRFSISPDQKVIVTARFLAIKEARKVGSEVKT